MKEIPNQTLNNNKRQTGQENIHDIFSPDKIFRPKKELESSKKKSTSHGDMAANSRHVTPRTGSSCLKPQHKAEKAN